MRASEKYLELKEYDTQARRWIDKEDRHLVLMWLNNWAGRCG